MCSSLGCGIGYGYLHRIPNMETGRRPGPLPAAANVQTVQLSAAPAPATEPPTAAQQTGPAATTAQQQTVGWQGGGAVVNCSGMWEGCWLTLGCDESTQIW